ncbi:MAG: signal peptidase I [candidate division Zixibacteria bacterium]|nr:signal peptidase I [candidate division Zixibacteria bacterium]
MHRKDKFPLKGYIKIALLVILIAVLLRAFVVQSYKLPSSSMEDLLIAGDFVMVNKLHYRYNQPKPGDVIVFKYPLNPSKNMLQRIMATEGQTVEIKNKIVYVDDKIVTEPYTAKHTDQRIFPGDYSPRDNFGPMQVPEGHLFVLGDNRDNSKDSREWGFLDANLIKGKALFVYWSWAVDPNAPKFRSPYITPLLEIIFYNLGHLTDRLHLSRIGTVVV